MNKIWNVNINYKSVINYHVKKHAVSYVVSDTAGQTFNLYRDFPPGYNTGYNYLFRVYGKHPQEGAKNLYILVYTSLTDFDPTDYYLTYAGKDIKIKQFDPIFIISVK